MAVVIASLGSDGLNCTAAGDGDVHSLSMRRCFAGSPIAASPIARGLDSRLGGMCMYTWL